jgi:hypothetical protein
MVKKQNFLGFLDTNRYYFRHYDLGSFALFVNGKEIASEGLSLGMDRENLPLWDTECSLMDLSYITRTRVFR